MGSTEFQLLVVFALILLSALASATETTLTSLGQADIHAILKVEKRRSRMLAWWDDDPNRVLTAILITNNLINILASSLATGITQEYLRRMGVDASIGLGVAVAVGVMTFLIVMFGEVVPKTFARNNPRSMLPFLPLMWLLCKLFSMPALALQRASGRVIRAVGGSLDNREKVTEAQIDSLIRIGAEQGSLTGETGDLLSSVMEFSETRSMEIMVPRTDVVAFEVNDSLQEVLRVMNEQKYSRYPVYEEDLDTIPGISRTRTEGQLQLPTQDPPRRYDRAFSTTERHSSPWALGWARSYTSCRRARVTCVYFWVVERREWPSSSWMSRRSAPPSRRWVANVWRRVWGCTFLASATRSTALSITLAIPLTVRRAPNRLISNASASTTPHFSEGTRARTA